MLHAVQLYNNTPRRRKHNVCYDFREGVTQPLQQAVHITLGEMASEGPVRQLENDAIRTALKTFVELRRDIQLRE